jgi:hypothetical protein
MMQQAVSLTYGKSFHGLEVDDLIEGFERLARGEEKDIRHALGLLGGAGKSVADEEQNELWDIGLSWLFLARQNGFGVSTTLNLLHQKIVGMTYSDNRYAKGRHKKFIDSGGSEGFNHFELSTNGKSLVDRLENESKGKIKLWAADPLSSLGGALSVPNFIWALQCPDGYQLARWDWDPPE